MLALGAELEAEAAKKAEELRRIKGQSARLQNLEVLRIVFQLMTIFEEVFHARPSEIEEMIQRRLE